MKANDARIGNYVSYKGKVYQLYSISEDYPFLDTDEFGVGVVMWEDLEPIELNEDVLKACGLTSNIPLVSEFGEIVYIYYDAPIFHFQEHKSFGCNEFEFSGFIPLHQLQNIYYSFTGQELTINKDLL